MKRPLMLLGLAAVLASCTPALVGPPTGRIVNNTTGEEGTISFVSGSLQPRLGTSRLDNNATIQIGNRTYVGRSVIIDTASPAPSPLDFGLSFNFGNAWDFNGNRDPYLGVGGSARTPAPRLVSRTGNLIARTDGNASRTLTCTLTVDVQEHGYGDCTDSGGVRYVLQF
ncbi:lipoprotein [Deinococcus aquatilis]|uniref:lipoprotein n=1 Tax=Deinococcus aquatilis TaxID=519440 RepID=UPI0003635547|nr:lipoprotein [Deinococcus aquatilis]